MDRKGFAFRCVVLMQALQIAREEVIMKRSSIKHITVWVFIISFLLCAVTTEQHQVWASDNGHPEQSEEYKREELSQMLAPIALYPDALLAQVLMAATYPIEVIEADRWMKGNPDLRGEGLDNALVDFDWDTSVKALCHFPPVLELMSERISETTNIGNAFLAQEEEVTDMIQELRARALAEGNLGSNAKQKVIVEKEKILIEPADPKVIFVPYYDTYYVYGTWWYPTYPPYYWQPSGIIIGTAISYWPGFSFGISFGTWSYFDWYNRHIYIDVHERPRFVRHDRWRTKPGYWIHTPLHRRGLAYSDTYTTLKFGRSHGRIGEFRSPSKRAPLRTDRIHRDERQLKESRDRKRGKSPLLFRQRQKSTRIAPVRERTHRIERPIQVQPRMITRDQAIEKRIDRQVVRQKQIIRQKRKKTRSQATVREDTVEKASTPYEGTDLRRQKPNGTDRIKRGTNRIGRSKRR